MDVDDIIKNDIKSRCLRELNVVETKKIHVSLLTPPNRRYNTVIVIFIISITLLAEMSV
jgi:hypothetical protein